MLDLVGNPEDRFSHDTAHIYNQVSLIFLMDFASFLGKFPHIIVSAPGKPSTTLGKDNLEAVIQFGPTPVGTLVQKMVELHNLSPVRHFSAS